jgi:hypothetical protein
VGLNEGEVEEERLSVKTKTGNRSRAKMETL